MRAELKRRGLMLILSSPSGAGKTTLARMLLDADPNLVMSVSATTRARRPSETDGKDYFFLSEAEFTERAARNEFLEKAQVFGHYYGTPWKPVADALKDGKDVLFDIDWQGTQQLKQHERDDVVSLFVLPPSRSELERRLKARAQDPESVVAARMAKANDELSHWAEYDYVIVNDDMNRALSDVTAILRSERLKRGRQIELPQFIGALKGER
jgi:guanylate kinase